MNCEPRSGTPGRGFLVEPFENKHQEVKVPI